MTKLSKVLALASLLLLGASSIKAQQNLILNPGFEEEHVWKKAGINQYVANHWSTPQRIDPSLSPNGRTGKALQIIPARITAEVRAIETKEVDGNLVTNANYIPVTPGSGYTLSFWYKVDDKATKYARLGVRFDWVKADGSAEPSTPQNNGALLPQRTLNSTTWKQETFVFTAPATADVRKLGLMLRLTNTDGDPILFDDISLIETSPAAPPAPPAPPAPAVPTELKATNKFQRELELSWAAGTAGTTWELQVDNASPIEISKNSHTLEDLDPNTSYAIKVRAKANNVASEWTSVLNVQTADYTERPESATRVPHLHTISEEGACQKKLLLYYNDLVNKAATISYKVDGISITPQGKTLTFPKTGKQVLSIEIAESSEKVWTLEYNVNVQ